jgi:hypothetical protein
MKKWLIFIFLLVLLALGSIYVFIPGTLIISKITAVNATPSAAYRFLSNEGRWKKWWPGLPSNTNAQPSSSGSQFIYKTSRFGVYQNFQQSVEIPISDQGNTIASQATVLAIPGDSAVIRWQTKLDAGWNPIGRILRYKRALEIKDDMTDILGSLRSFLDNKENVYGQRLSKSSSVDTLLIATKSSFSHYPSTADIYQMVGSLAQFSGQLRARQTGYPMINLTKSDSGQYQVMVALPVDKALSGKGNIFPRRMIPGKFIVSEIQGGPSRVDEALTEMQNYFDDYKKVSMAIRFQSLITDRTKEPDSNRWVTKLYAPVF